MTTTFTADRKLIFSQCENYRPKSHNILYFLLFFFQLFLVFLRGLVVTVGLCWRYWIWGLMCLIILLFIWFYVCMEWIFYQLREEFLITFFIWIATLNPGASQNRVLKQKVGKKQWFGEFIHMWLVNLFYVIVSNFPKLYFANYKFIHFWPQLLSY